MIKLYLANQLEDLFEELLKKLEETQNNKSNPYEPFYILIPNKNIQYWLKQKIAEKQNIVMNYEFHYFEEGIWNLYIHLIKKYNIFNEQKIIEEERIDPNFLSLIIYKILNNFQNNQSPLKYFKNYLEEHKNYPGNIYNLSLELSEIFFQYNFHNPELVKKLEEELTEKINQNDVIQDILHDEKIIYQQTQKEIEKFNEKNNTNYVLFFNYQNNFKENIKKIKEKIQEPIPLFIFAFQFNNVFYYKLLKELKEILDIHYFQFILYDYNQKIKEYQNIAQEISRNNIELFKEITEISEKDISYIKINSNNHHSLLHQIQLHFIKNDIDKLKENHHNDLINEEKPSIKFIEAPDKRSEIKAIINDIQEELLKDNDLKLNDIAILSPKISEYFPLLRGYLDYLNIPYNIQDPSIVETSYFPEGVQIICNLIDDILNKEIILGKNKVISILENPVFQKTHKITLSDIEIFYKFIESLNIYYENENDYYHSWEVALKRLRAGKITDEILEFQINETNLKILPYEDFEVNIDILEKVHRSLVEFIEDIKYLANIFKDPDKSVIDKYNEFEKIILKHFNVFLYKETFHIEKKAYNEFLQKLSYLKYFEDIEPNGNFLYVYFDLMFNEIKGNIHEYLFNGITISSLQPLRPIPFKRIYILGLNQENFPGKEIKKSFKLIDLMLDEKSPYKKNILTKPQENQFLFYEIFFSTRECLILSYINLDIVNKKELYPSFIYQELKDFVRKITNMEQYFQKIPLTLKLKENKIFNHSFEFYNTLLATYKDQLKLLREKTILKDVDYLNLIFKEQEDSIKDIYKKIKFNPEKIEFTNKESINDKEYVDINKLLEYFLEPLKYYFEKNQLL